MVATAAINITDAKLVIRRAFIKLINVTFSDATYFYVKKELATRYLHFSGFIRYSPYESNNTLSGQIYYFKASA